MSIEALGKHIIVAPIRRDKKTQDMHFIVQSLDENSQGEVKHIGPLVPRHIKPGMIIIFGNTRQKITMEGGEMNVMTYDNLIAIKT